MKLSFSYRSTYFFIALIVSFSAANAQSNLKLDYSFGQNGFVLNDVARYSDDDLHSVVAINNSTLLAVGKDPKDIVISKLDTNGRFDQSFGNEGTLLLDLGNIESVSSTLLLDNEFVLIAGLTRNDDWSFQKSFLIKLSILTQKTDKNFGVDGVIYLPIQNTLDRTKLIKADDNHFLVGGSYHNRIHCFRYDNEGQLDSTFGSPSGFVFRQADSSNISLADMALQHDSIPLLVVNNGRSPVFVIRLNPDASLSSTYGVPTKAETSFQAVKLLLNSKQEPLICGTTQFSVDNKDHHYPTIAKLTASLLPDQLFGLYGLVVGENPAHRGNFIQTAKLMSDSRILLAGSVDSIAPRGNRKSNFQVVLFTASGQLDTAFGNKGFTTFQKNEFSGLHEGIRAIVQIKNSLYFGGFTTHGLGIPARSHIVSKLNIEGFETLSVKAIQHKTSVAVYPNPTLGEIKIESGSFDSFPYSIYNTKGQLVQGGISTGKIEIQGPAGLYFLRSSSFESVRIIKE
jgi:uncharacterized delta-60 repeat protein